LLVNGYPELNQDETITEIVIVLWILQNKKVMEMELISKTAS
jgi:hypothetical protein